MHLFFFFFFFSVLLLRGGAVFVTAEGLKATIFCLVPETNHNRERRNRILRRNLYELKQKGNI